MCLTYFYYSLFWFLQIGYVQSLRNGDDEVEWVFEVSVSVPPHVVKNTAMLLRSLSSVSGQKLQLDPAAISWNSNKFSFFFIELSIPFTRMLLGLGKRAMWSRTHPDNYDHMSKTTRHIHDLELAAVILALQIGRLERSVKSTPTTKAWNLI